MILQAGQIVTVDGFPDMPFVVQSCHFSNRRPIPTHYSIKSRDGSMNFFAVPVQILHPQSFKPVETAR